MESHFKVLVGTQEVSFRGVDYRAPTVGIMLLLANTFSNTRAYVQALDRVGRYGDICKRVELGGLTMVDNEKKMANLAELLAF